MSAANQEVHNWGKDIWSNPAVVVTPNSVEELQAIMRDRDTYPSPVRAVGSNHSTTRCAVAEGGTVVRMERLSQILEVGEDSVTAQGGALYLDVATRLEAEGKQLFVNVELGNLTMGSACTGGTKDASMPGEVGQVCSYATVIRMVAPDGELIEFNESDPQALQYARSSYGLFGIVYEVSFRIQPLRGMRVYHETYSLERFLARLPELTGRDQSMMLYLFPHEDKVTVEYRDYMDGQATDRRWVWKLRNYVWKTFAPGFGWFVTKYIPWAGLRYWLVDGLNKILRLMMNYVLKGPRTSPTAQMIRYPETSGRSKYTFSIWAFPEAEYPDIIRGYYAFCKDYYRKYGWRCDMLNVGYRIKEDQGSLFSYSYDATVLTLDPVATGAHGWDEFLRAYNAFCSERGGIPLFNQTKWIEPAQARRAFGERIDRFRAQVERYDPDGRMLNRYFRERFFDTTG
jgi:FAD/FMN-containing dehydrogenase